VETEPGFPVELCGTTELDAAFREESCTSFPSASAALQEIREAIGLFVVPFQGKSMLRDLYQTTVIAKLREGIQIDE
jgi:hypothetical protein